MAPLLLRHVAIPGILPGLFLLVVSMPVDVVGCRPRALLAASLALAGALAGLSTAGVALIRRMRGAPRTGWWVISTLVLVIPAVVVLAIAG